MPHSLADVSAALQGRYTVERELGRGGMAVVYLAHDLKHERLVALKVLHPELAQTLGPDRFKREIQLTSRLDHPNVLPVLDSATAEGKLWYGMPYVEGGSLRGRLDKGGPLGIEEAMRIAREVARALDHAHQRGIVHRDVKPENILLSGGRVLVADFGIAKLLGSGETQKLTDTGLSLGTPAYMSPEQADGRGRLDGRADVYALGCVLYEMLTGAPPFGGASAQAILARHAIDPVPSVRTVRGTVAPALEAVVRKALAKVPADRFDTAGEFANALVPEALEAVERANAVDGVPTLALQPAGVSAGRRRWMQALVLTALLSAVTGVAGWLLRRELGPPVLPSAELMAVMPFAPAGDDSVLARLGRDLASTVSANLDGVGEIRMVDRLTILAQTNGRRNALALRDGADLARRYGAKSLVAGSLAREGARVRLDIGLYSSDSLAPLVQAVITGEVDSLSALTDSVTWRVLQAVWRRGKAPTPSLEAITTRSVPALRAYLDGEQASIAGRLTDAKAAYQRAIAADSTFWYAYFLYASTSRWSEEEVEPAIVRAYFDHRELLPRRERLMVEASELDSGLVWRRERFEALTREYPDYWPAWFMLGDGYVHFYPYIGSTRADARRCLERAVALNPGLVFAWAHLVWMYQADRDTVAAAHALDVLERLGARAIFVENIHEDALLVWRSIQALQTRDPAAGALLDSVYQSAQASIAAGEGIPFTYFLALTAASPAAQIDLNRRLLRRDLPPDSSNWLLYFTALNWAARGAWDSALVTIDRTTETGRGWNRQLEAYRLAVLGVWLGAVQNARAAERRPAAAQIAQLNPPLQAEVAWLDGILAVTRQDRAAVEAARAAMRAAGDTLIDRSRLVDLAPFDLALRGNRAAAGAQLAALELESADRNPWMASETHPLRRAINRMAAAPWLLAAGDTARAALLLTWPQSFSGPFMEKIAVASLATLQLARIEEARGQRVEARRDYREFLIRYDMPPVGQRQLVVEAREALVRLSGTPDTAEGRAAAPP